MSRRRRRLVGAAEDRTHGVSVGVAIAVVGDNRAALTGVLWMHNLYIAHVYEHTPRQAIVVTTDPWIYSRVVAALNTPAALASPTATRDTVWALATSTQFSQLSATFPHRTLYLLTGDRTNMTFKPWRGGREGHARGGRGPAGGARRGAGCRRLVDGTVGDVGAGPYACAPCGARTARDQEAAP
jgi:hypothetical protein